LLVHYRTLVRSGVLSLTAMLLLFVTGCATEPGLDKGKFDELIRAAQELRAAIGSGKACDVPDSVLQRLVSGTAALRGKIASKAERDLLAAFANLATSAQDGLLLCRSRSQLAVLNIVPKGRINVTQELDPIVDKYDLPIESHVYAPTGARLKTISVDAIKVIWEKAAVQIRNIEVTLKYS